MAKKRTTRPEKKMKSLHLVFCEGETEENYINFLKNKYRNPVKVISKIVGQNISQKLIACYEKAEHISKSDNIKSFIMYDLDTTAINEKLQACKAIHLFSNPCIELWFLLHLRDKKASITAV